MKLTIDQIEDFQEQDNVYIFIIRQEGQLVSYTLDSLIEDHFVVIQRFLRQRYLTLKWRRGQYIISETPELREQLEQMHSFSAKHQNKSRRMLQNKKRLQKLSNIEAHNHSLPLQEDEFKQAQPARTPVISISSLSSNPNSCIFPPQEEMDYNCAMNISEIPPVQENSPNRKSLQLQLEQLHQFGDQAVLSQERAQMAPDHNELSLPDQNQEQNASKKMLLEDSDQEGEGWQTEVKECVAGLEYRKVISVTIHNGVYHFLTTFQKDWGRKVRYEQLWLPKSYFKTVEQKNLIVKFFEKICGLYE